MRLQKFLAYAGVGSRRACEELILQGRVVVNGQEVRQLGTKIDPAKDRVTVDGERLQTERFVYYAVHKPKGYVSTNDDPAGRPRVVDLLPEIPQRVYTVGRLDEASVGLILLTNDGELANRLTHPKYGVEKIYRVLVAGKPGPEIAQQLVEGVWLAEGKVRALQARLAGERGEATIIEIVLAEGKNREIRRMLAKMGHKVMSLTRVAVGPILLKGIPMGGWRSLTKGEVDLLRKWSVGERPAWASKRLTAPAPTPSAPRRGAARHQQQDPTIPRPPKPPSSPAPSLGPAPRRPGKPDPARLNPPKGAVPGRKGEGPAPRPEKSKGEGGLPTPKPRPALPPSRRGNQGEPVEVPRRKIIGMDFGDFGEPENDRPRGPRPGGGNRYNDRNSGGRPAGPGGGNRPQGGRRNDDRYPPRQGQGGPQGPYNRGGNQGGGGPQRNQFAGGNDQELIFDPETGRQIKPDSIGDRYFKNQGGRPGPGGNRPGGPRQGGGRPPQGGNRPPQQGNRNFRPGPGGPPPRPPRREDQAPPRKQQEAPPPPPAALDMPAPPRPKPTVKRPKPKGRPSFRRPKDSES